MIDCYVLIDTVKLLWCNLYYEKRYINILDLSTVNLYLACSSHSNVPLLPWPSGFSSRLIWFCLQWKNFRNTSWIHAHIRSHRPVFSITLLLNGSEELAVCKCVSSVHTEECFQLASFKWLQGTCGPVRSEHLWLGRPLYAIFYALKARQPMCVIVRKISWHIKDRFNFLCIVSLCAFLNKINIRKLINFSFIQESIPRKLIFNIQQHWNVYPFV